MFATFLIQLRGKQKTMVGESGKAGSTARKLAS